MVNVLSFFLLSFAIRVHHSSLPSFSFQNPAIHGGFPARSRHHVTAMYSGENLLPILTSFTSFLGEIEKGQILGFQWPTSFEEIKVKNL